jgi:quercetin dioxygenase-like cupin family protein
VFCFEAATGKVVWSKNAQKETEAKIPDWGFAGSPYVAGDLVILNVGQSGMALKKGDGKTVWSSGKESAAGYSTAYPLAGDKGIVVLAAEDAYHAVEVATGKVVWSLPWKTRYGVNAASPIQSGDKLFISSGYNRGCGLFQLGGGTPTAIWENKNLRNQFNSSVLIDGFVHGIDDDESKKASLRCVELATGEVKWTEKGIGFGALMAADGKLTVDPFPPALHKHGETVQGSWLAPDGTLFAAGYMITGVDGPDTALVHFHDGAVTFWHSHPGGQQLFVVSGSARVGTRDDGEVALAQGTLVVCPADEPHWHGAAAGADTTLLAITWGTTAWTDEAPM